MEDIFNQISVFLNTDLGVKTVFLFKITPLIIISIMLKDLQLTKMRCLSSEDNRENLLSVISNGSSFFNGFFIKKVLEQGLDINCKDECGYTLFLKCLYLRPQRLKDVKLLVNAGADIYAEVGEGFNAVYFSCFCDDEKILGYFISKGVNCWKTVNGKTYLEVASEHSENPRIIDLLVSRGLDINFRNKGNCNKTPLMVAAQYNTPKVIERIISLGGDVNMKDNNGLDFIDYMLKNERPFLKLSKIYNKYRRD